MIKLCAAKYAKKVVDTLKWMSKCIQFVNCYEEMKLLQTINNVSNAQAKTEAQHSNAHILNALK